MANHNWGKYHNKPMRIQSKNGREIVSDQTRLVFALSLIGWEGGVIFLNQSCSKTRLLNTYLITDYWRHSVLVCRYLWDKNHLEIYRASFRWIFHRFSTKFSSVLPCCLLKVPKVLNLPLNDLGTVSEDSLVSCNPSDSFCCSVVAVVSLFSRLLSAFLSSSWNILKAPKDSSSGQTTGNVSLLVQFVVKVKWNLSIFSIFFSSHNNLDWKEGPRGFLTKMP